MTYAGPASLRPRPHHPVLRRSAEALQFGVGPGGSVEVSGADPALRRLLLQWRGGTSVDEVVERAVAAGVEEATVHSTLTELRAAGALVDAAGPERVQAARAGAAVLLAGEGPLLAGVASTLGASGVGRLVIAGSGTVLAEDVGPFAAEDRGHPRAAAAVRAVHRVAPGVRCASKVPGRRPDLVVLTDLLHPEHPPSGARATPHLLVRLVDGLGLVGPLVLPGRTACLRCLDLHLAAGDPCWPTVAADLVGRVGSAGPATVAATAALAAEQALAALDVMAAAGPPPPTLDGVLELDARHGTLRRRHWPAHPRCSCGAGHSRSSRPMTSAATAPAEVTTEAVCGEAPGSRESRA